MSHRKQVALRLLPAALAATDADVIAACRRVIIADHLGWEKHGVPADWRIVATFAETLKDLEG